MSEIDDHRALVHDRWPQLELATFEPIAGGWDCFTYLADGEWILQLPRLPDAPARIRKQIGMLPELAREVSAAIPVPELAWDGDPPCMGYRRIDGSAISAGVAGIWPERLGRFLYDLHMVPPEIVGMRAFSPEAVRNARRAEVGALAPHVLPLLGASARTRAERSIETFLDDDANFVFASCLTHGDVGPEHVLLSPRGDLAGVIDWGDAAVGDPASDLAWIVCALPQEGARTLAAYGGPPDARFLTRCRFAFMMMPWHEVKHGVETGQPSLVASGLEGVRERLGS